MLYCMFSASVVGELVRNSFIIERLTVNSRETFSVNQTDHYLF